MTNSYLIWIPSIQNYIRFKELSWDQLRSIIKIIDEKNIEFIYQLNNILLENKLEDIDIDNLTILDRFVIFIQLKLHSCGSILSLGIECGNCQTKIKLNADLNEILNKIARLIDKKFTREIINPPYRIICDIPTIKTEYEIFKALQIYDSEQILMEMNIDNYVLSYIKNMYISDNFVDLDSFSYKDRLMVFHKIPSKVLDKIKHNFLDPINDSIKNISFVDFLCQNKKCEEKISFNFSFTNINDFLKIVYRDYSVESLLQDIMSISIKTQLGGDFISKMTPIEMEIMMNFVRQQEASSVPESPESRDLFEEQLKMKESPSEFS